MNLIKQNGAIVNGVQVPEQLKGKEFAEAYAFYIEYMKENYSRWPTSTATAMDFQKLKELHAEGNDPIEVIKQTVQGRNKSFYPVRNFNKSDKSKLSSHLEAFE